MCQTRQIRQREWLGLTNTRNLCPHSSPSCLECGRSFQLDLMGLGIEIDVLAWTFGVDVQRVTRAICIVGESAVTVVVLMDAVAAGVVVVIVVIATAVVIVVVIGDAAVVVDQLAITIEVEGVVAAVVRFGPGGALEFERAGTQIAS